MPNQASSVSMYSMWVMTCLLFLSTLQMMYPGSGCLLSSYQTAFPIRSQGTLSFFHLWTCWYSFGSMFCPGIMCTMSPGSLLLVTSMGVVIFSLGECSCVTTLQGHLMASHLEALGRSLGMTLSHMDSVFSLMRSVRQLKRTLLVAR